MLRRYEPLWTLDKEEAKDIYLQTFRSLSRTCVTNLISTCYVVYIAVDTWGGGARDALNDVGAKCVVKDTINTLFFGDSCELLVYRL